MCSGSKHKWVCKKTPSSVLPHSVQIPEKTFNRCWQGGWQRPHCTRCACPETLQSGCSTFLGCPAPGSSEGTVEAAGSGSVGGLFSVPWYLSSSPFPSAASGSLTSEKWQAGRLISHTVCGLRFLWPAEGSVASRAAQASSSPPFLLEKNRPSLNSHWSLLPELQPPSWRNCSLRDWALEASSPYTQPFAFHLTSLRSCVLVAWKLLFLHL